jgi:hypothetical protein
MNAACNMHDTTVMHVQYTLYSVSLTVGWQIMASTPCMQGVFFLSKKYDMNRPCSLDLYIWCMRHAVHSVWMTTREALECQCYMLCDGVHGYWQLVKLL